MSAPPTPFADALDGGVPPAGQTASGRPRVVGRGARALRDVAWSLPALPLAVLLHEGAHLVAGRMFGLAGVRLHHAAVSSETERLFWRLMHDGGPAAASAAISFPHLAAATFAGLAVSYATIAGCAIAAWRSARRGEVPHPLVIALGLAATPRFAFGVQVLRRLLFTTDHQPSHTDEGVVAATTGFPEVVLWTGGLLLVVGGIVVLVRALHPAHRWAHFGRLALGAAIGAALYFGAIGPALLP